MTTTSKLIEEWAEDGDPDEWPYPTLHRTYRIEGDLADKVRSRSGLEGEVRIIEEVISGGYSEWTQENDYPFEIEVDYQKVFEYGWGNSSLGESLGWNSEIPTYGFSALNNWLNEKED